MPPSEYGPIRDIYDPNFAAAYYGGAVAQDAPVQDVPAGRLTGLEPRWSRRRRAVMSGVATALAVVLVVGLIAFAVWQTQQGDDGRETALVGAGTPSAAEAAAGVQPPADADAAGDPDGDGEVAAGAPGETARPTEAADETETADDADTADDRAQDAGADDQADEDGASDAGDGETASARRQPTADPTANQGGRSLANLVPSDDEIPRDFVLTDEGKWDQATVAGAFSDPEAAAEQLDAWGWRGSQYRQFERSPDAPPVGGATTFLVVSVHRFDSAESADAALTYFADEVIAAQGLEPVEVQPLGDEVIALVGSPDASTLVVLYIRTGPYLIRIGGFSPDGDPAKDVVNLAEVILVNEPEDRGDTV